MPGLYHFAARHFSKLHHFFSVHLAGFQVEVLVGKKPNRAGTKPYTPLNDHEIVIRITKGDKVWEDRYTVSRYFAEPLINVSASMLAFRQLIADIRIKITMLAVNTKKIFVKGRKLP